MASIRFATLLALGMFVLQVAAEEPKKPTPKFKLGKDTTFVTEPLDADGYIDYEAALNNQLKGTTTPETNAVVLLVKCFGPKPDGKELHPDFYKALGVEGPPAEAEYLIDYFQFFKEELKVDETRHTFLESENEMRWRPWKAAELPRHAEWLKLNEKPIAVAIEATKRKDYYLPLISRHKDGKKGMLIGASMQTTQFNQNLATLLSMRAMLLAGEGKIEAAFDHTVALHKHGRMVARGGSLYEVLAGIAIEGIANSTGIAILEYGNSTAKQAMAYQAELAKNPPIRLLADQIDRNDRLMNLDSIQWIRRSGYDIFEPLRIDRKEKTPREIERYAATIDWEEVMRYTNGWIDKSVTALRKPNFLERNEALKDIESSLKVLEEQLKNQTGVEKFLQKLGKPEEVRAKQTEQLGKKCVTNLMIWPRKIAESYDRAEQQHQSCIIAAALAAHFADHKKYPDKLNDLVPKYLAKVPDDLFNSKPLNYKKTDRGYLFYSVGINGKDDGGKLFTDEIRNDEARGDDLGVRMPRNSR